MTAQGLWVRVAVSTALAGLSLLVLSPQTPGSRLPALPAALLGLAAGLGLYLLIARRRPWWPLRRGCLALTCAKYGLLGLLAADEEILWRHALLGELLRSGRIAGCAAATVLFALAHRSRPALHLATGATFGGLYLTSGVLAASVAAHWAYNALLATLREHARALPEGAR